MFRLLDFAIAAYRYFPIANEAEDLDIDQRLIKNFITISSNSDIDIFRSASIHKVPSHAPVILDIL